MSDKARIAAFHAVQRIFKGAYSNLIPMSEGLTGVDRAFAESLALGTLERKNTLSYILSFFVKKDTKSDILALLMTGVYQIIYMDKVPESAACDETVKIAKQIFGKTASGFVNAVMRNVCRNKNKIVSDLEKTDGHIRFSANEELYKLLAEQYPDDIERIFNSFFGKSPTFVRVNTLRTDAISVAERTDGKVIDGSCVVCENAQSALAEIDKGDFYIQGLASQKAVKLLSAKEGDTLIDVCACPGGKSLGAAIDMRNNGRIYSFDIHRNKLSLIEKSAERLGITIIEASEQDARHAKEELIGIADKVICDVPCSGTGVMGSKPEIKYKSPEDFTGLYNTQRAIISEAAKYLKIGGEMVYSTCSINKIENEAVVSNFLAENSGYKLVYEKTCLPFEEEHEGFYMAKIIREI